MTLWREREGRALAINSHHPRLRHISNVRKRVGRRHGKLAALKSRSLASLAAGGIIDERISKIKAQDVKLFDQYYMLAKR